MKLTSIKSVQFLILATVSLFGILFFSLDAQAANQTITRDLTCSGSGYCGSPACSEVWTVSDTDSSFITSAWRGSYRQWDDVAAIRATVNGVERLYERSDNLDIRGWNTSRPDCGCSDSGCTGSDNPGGRIIFQRFGETNVSISMNISAEEKFKTNGTPGTFAGTAAFGYARTVCDPGERNVNGQCVSVTGTLTVTPATCISPCDVTINWNTNSLNNARVVRNSSLVLYNGNSVPTGNTSNLSLSAGTYTYCLTGYDGFGSITADLDCETVTVNNPVVVVTNAPTCSPSNPPAVAIGEPVILTGSGGDGTFRWTATGGNPGTQSDVGVTTSTFTTSFSTAGVKTVLVRDGLDRTSNPCNVTVINPATSSNAYVYIAATPSSGPAGSASTLQWTVYNATSCYANGGWSGPKSATTGSNTESITINSSPTTYTITCVNANNNTSMTGSVTVSPSGGVTVAPLCGNNQINAGETCDTGSLRGTCPSTCSTSCSLNSCAPPPVIGQPTSYQSCGNGIVEGSEACDKGSSPTTGNGTCYSQCSTSCTIASVCPPLPVQVCGNGSPEGYEQCDDGPANGNCSSTVSPRCSTMCTINSCNPPTVVLRANPTTTPYANGFGATVLSWDVTNADRGCVATASTATVGNAWSGAQNSSTGRTHSSGLIRYLNDDATFTLACTSWDGRTTRGSVTVYRERPPKTNLVVTNFSVTDDAGNVKSTFQVGELVYPSVTVRNNSSMSVTGTYVNSFFKNRPLPVTVYGTVDDIRTTDSNTISAGLSRTYAGIGSNFIRWNQNSVSYSAPGTYVARIFVDSENNIDESDESITDNQLTTVITIVGAPVVAPIVTLNAPASVVSGTGVPLTWSATQSPTSCTASASPATSPWSGTQLLNGSVTTAPITGQTTFTLSCTNAGGTGTNSKTVNVTAAIPQPPVVTISANPSSGVSPLSTRITWSATNNPTCSGTVSPTNPPIPSWTGPKAASGFLDLNLTSSKTFNLICSNAGGLDGNSVAVTVVPPAPVATNKTLTITTPVNNGKVTSTDTFIDCGVGGNPTKCSRTYSSVGCSTVTLNAVPSSSSWRFTGWGGACTAAGTGVCNLNLCSDSSVSASFGRRPLNYEEF